MKKPLTIAAFAASLFILNSCSKTPLASPGPGPNPTVTDVYVGGYEANSDTTYIAKYYAKYWKNGVFNQLTDGTNFAATNAITVNNYDICCWD